MALWPFVVAGVWCCVMVPWHLRIEEKNRQRRARYAPMRPPPPAPIPPLADAVVMFPFVFYHLPVFVPVIWLSMARETARPISQLELLAAIFLTAALYSAVFTWVL